jgi:hypothetical protein
MQQAARERVILVPFQAWFDDSGKEGIQGSPVYLLAGFSARVPIWKAFADEWQTELNQPPKLQYVHAREAYGWKGPDFDPREPSEWNAAYGPRNRDERDKRLVKFAKLIVKHIRPEEAYGLSFITTHQGYGDFTAKLARVQTTTIQDHEEFELLKNPYYLAFQKIIGQELKLRMAQGLYRGVVEQTEVFFDEHIDEWENLEFGFKQFVRMLETTEPNALQYLKNKKTPEGMDDKQHLPLQASDLYAWHVRRIFWEVNRRAATRYDDPVWRELRDNGVRFYEYRYQGEDWDRILTHARVTALQQFGIWTPPRR